jgi:hypothetical protein
MANSEFGFAGINLDEDTFEIPILTPILKILHMWLPTIFTPFILKVSLIFILTPLVVMYCFAWSNRKCHESLNREIDLDSFLKKSKGKRVADKEK